jgi:RimJ/RimL family protein N-acetyltransferase
LEPPKRRDDDGAGAPLLGKTLVVPVLRDVRQSDLLIFFEQQRDPGAMRLAVFPERDRETFMSHWLNILADDDITKKTVVFEGQVAGNIVSFERDDKRLVGYWLGREFWGKGLATEALAELLTELTERPLHAYVATTNLGSIRVLEKCGFTLAGRRVRHEAFGEVEEALYVLKD